MIDYLRPHIPYHLKLAAAHCILASLCMTPAIGGTRSVTDAKASVATTTDANVDDAESTEEGASPILDSAQPFSFNADSSEVPCHIY